MFTFTKTTSYFRQVASAISGSSEVVLRCRYK